jgi:hypothetical protein
MVNHFFSVLILALLVSTSASAGGYLLTPSEKLCLKSQEVVACLNNKIHQKQAVIQSILDVRMTYAKQSGNPEAALAQLNLNQYIDLQLNAARVACFTKSTVEGRVCLLSEINQKLVTLRK